MDKSVQCPKCGSEIAISEVLAHQIRDQIVASVKADHAKQLEDTKKSAQAEIQKAQHELESQLNKKFQEKFELELKLAKEASVDHEKRNRELMDQLTEMTKQMRVMKQEADETRLSMEKKLAEEQDKIREDAAKKAEEEQHLKVAEMEKKLQDAVKANEDLRRKLQQGSQQTQGEVLELELEEQLKKEFPNDIITPVNKGVRGGDIMQEVIDRNGNSCGKILWELKNTKAWSGGWIDKLKQDQRRDHADQAIIVSEVLPPGISSSCYYNGIWVSERNFAICMAMLLRHEAIYVRQIKQTVSSQNELKDVLFRYYSGTEFRHRIEALVDAFNGMRDENEKEKRWFALKWARDEKHIRNLIDNTYGMYGDLKAIMGNTLPQIKGIDVPELADGEIIPPIKGVEESDNLELFESDAN